MPRPKRLPQIAGRPPAIARYAVWQDRISDDRRSLGAPLEKLLSGLNGGRLLTDKTNMMDTRQLLTRYTKEDSEEAFRELVARYLDLVYSTAIRRVGGDAHLAQDVVQTVFSDLARKAAKLPAEVLLGGWLHRHTCFVASMAVRAERRRHAREQTAAHMQSTNDHSEARWQEIAPLLDDAINELDGEDRAAVVLRFFERRELRAVGAELGVSEEAARKRVTRAVDKLRGLLGRRGVTTSAAALAVALGAETIMAAPAALSLTVANSALAGAGATGGLDFTFLKLMTLTKLKLGTACALLAIGMAIPFIVHHHFPAHWRNDHARLAEQAEELADLRAENAQLMKAGVDPAELARLRKEHGELLRLRGEVGLLRKESQELARLRVQKRGTNHPPAESGSGPGREFLPAEAWANVGNATPEAALQTFFWAARQRETDLVGKLIRWRAADSVPKVEGIERIMESLVPASSRFVSELDGIKVIGQREETGDTARLRVEFTDKDGKAAPRELQLVREDGQWMPLFHAWSPKEGSLQAGLDVPLTPGWE